MRFLPCALLATMLLPTPAMAQSVWPDHAGFALRPRINFSVRPAPLLPFAQRPARIYAIELVPLPAQPADLHLTLQRRRQRVAALMAARADHQPRSSLRLVDIQMDLPQMDERLSAMVGWQAAKFSNKAVNATSPYSRDDLRVRDDFVPSAHLGFAATPRLALTADYRETVRGYADIGTIGAMGLDQPAYRALRQSLRPERDSRTRIGLRWAAMPALQLDVAAYDGQVRDRLAFVEGGYRPHNLGSAHMQGVALEARHSLSPRLRWGLRYDRARIDPDRGAALTEERLAVQGEWRHGPWRCAMSAARTSMSAWGQGANRMRMEGGIDYVPADPRSPRIGLHLTDPDRLMSGRLADQPQSGPIRAADQARALMLSAALRW